MFDTPSEVVHSEKDVADELDLWVRDLDTLKKNFLLMTNYFT